MGKNKRKSKKIKQGNVRQRVQNSFNVVTVILGTGSLIGIIALFAMTSIYEHALTNYGFSQGDIGKAVVVLSETRSSLRAAVGYSTDDLIADMTDTYEQKKEAFDGYFADIESTIVTSEGQELYDRLTGEMDEY